MISKTGDRVLGYIAGSKEWKPGTIIETQARDYGKMYWVKFDHHLTPLPLTEADIKLLKENKQC